MEEATERDASRCPRVSTQLRTNESRGHDGGTRVGTHVKPLDSFVSASTSCLQLSQKGSAALLGMVATPAMVTASRTQSARESEEARRSLPFGAKKSGRESGGIDDFAAWSPATLSVLRVDHETADSAAKNDGIKVFGIARRVTTTSGHLVAHEFHVSGSR